MAVLETRVEKINKPSSCPWLFIITSHYSLFFSGFLAFIGLTRGIRRRASCDETQGILYKRFWPMMNL